MQRVKVYRLNDEGLWDDKGTGHVSVDYSEETDTSSLVVVSEGDSRTLLSHRITRATSYQRQGDDTIITWTDPDAGTDVALSFQEPRGCNAIWNHVQRVQDASGGDGDVMRRRYSAGAMMDEFDSVGRHFGDLGGTPHDPGSSGAAELPPPELGSLPAIAAALSEVSLFRRERVAAQMLRQSYLPKLLDAFRAAEDLEDEPSLHTMYHIIKSAVLLNDTTLLEALFDEAHVADVIGALEYEPEVPPELRPKHRDFLRDKAVFKEVVPIGSASVRAKIHQSYRLGYVKDVVLPRVLDDATFATLSSLILFNNVEVLMSLHQDPAFFPELFRRLKAAAPESTEWRDLVAFLQELCGLAKHLQASQRNALLARLVSLGLFEVMTNALATGEPELQLRATDILLADVGHDPGQLRTFVLAQQGHRLFGLLVDLLLEGAQPGLQEAVLEMLRALLDPETMDASVEKDKFIDMFYEQYIGRLLSAVVAAGENPDTQSGAVSAGTAGLVVELLCSCVAQHSYRIKYYILRNNVVEKVLKLLRRREQWLVVAAVRFLRTCLGMKDEFYNRYLVKNGLLEPVLRAFVANGSRYNLLNSSALELLDFIRKENMKGLIAAVVASPLWPELESVAYVDTLRALRLRHEQNQERAADVQQAQQQVAAGGGGAAAVPEALWRSERQQDADEEAYFREGGDEEEQQERLAPVAGPAEREVPPPAVAPGVASTVGSGRSPLPGLGDGGGGGGPPLPPLRLVDYEDDDEEGFQLRAATFKRSPAPAAERPGSPPLDKRLRGAEGPAGVAAAAPAEGPNAAPARGHAGVVVEGPAGGPAAARTAAPAEGPAETPRPVLPVGGAAGSSTAGPPPAGQ